MPPAVTASLASQSSLSGGNPLAEMTSTSSPGFGGRNDARVFQEMRLKANVGPVDNFSSGVDALANGDVGFKFYLMPYRDRVYLDVRRYDADPGNTYTTPWKLKDWGESTVLPHIFKSLNRVVPMQSVRYRLIDTISVTTQSLVNSRYVKSGSNAASQSGPGRQRGPRRCFYSTWCFPAVDFSMVVRAYREFCERAYEESRYRCDMPAVGYRLGRDAGSLLSPSYDEPMFALTSASTQEKGWDDFVIDLAEFAEKWGGIPLISQSRALRRGAQLADAHGPLQLVEVLGKHLVLEGRDDEHIPPGQGRDLLLGVAHRVLQRGADQALEGARVDVAEVGAGDAGAGDGDVVVAVDAALGGGYQAVELEVDVGDEQPVVAVGKAEEPDQSGAGAGGGECAGSPARSTTFAPRLVGMAAGRVRDRGDDR